MSSGVKMTRKFWPRISASRVAEHLLGPGVPARDDALGVEREDGEADGPLDDDPVPLAVVGEVDPGPPGRGDVLDGEQDEFRVIAGPTDLAAVQEHPPPADALEVVRDLEVAERVVLGEDVFEERPQLGDVPLAVAQLVDEPALGLLGA